MRYQIQLYKGETMILCLHYRYSLQPYSTVRVTRRTTLTLSNTSVEQRVTKARTIISSCLKGVIFVFFLHYLLDEI